MKKILLLLFLSSGTAHLVSAQDTIVVFDQPGYTTSPFIVPRKSLQFEFGTSYNQITGLNETIFPSLLTRVPLDNRAEFRLTFNYEPQSNTFILDDVANNNDPLAVGFKQKLFYQKGKRPHMAIAGNVFYPIQKLNNIVASELCADTWILSQYNINAQEIILCAGYIRGNERLRDIFSWAFCYGHMLTENICVFGEYFGFYYFDSRLTEHAFDAGLTYEFGNTFQLDVCYYYNLDPNQRMGYISGGISYNLQREKRN